VRTGRTLLAAALLAAACAAPSPVGPAPGSSTPDGGADGVPDAPDAGPGPTLPPFLTSAAVLVDGSAYNSFARNCRTEMCRHSENTDMIAWGGAGTVWLVHRSAMSQALGPNSALHVYRSDDGGSTFAQTALLDAPADRDIRDPAFYVVGQTLFLKALTRVNSFEARDTDVDTVTVAMQSTDGVAWTPMRAIGPHGWSFWRVKEDQGVYYSAAYEDGDRAVTLFRSTDGLVWSAGPVVYDVSADTPLETELTFLPGGKMLALVRMDGTDQDLLGDSGPLRTKVCWSDPPYATFACPQEFAGVRLDGPVSFLWQGRLLVVARKHLQGGTDAKRTALYEIGGDLQGGPLTIREWGELPSAGDTSYAGVAMIDPTHARVSWYSGDLQKDEAWVLGMLDWTSIWLGTVDLARLQ
jgi:hypothetical protein